MLNSKIKFSFLASVLAAMTLSACGPGFKTEEEKKTKSVKALNATASNPRALLPLAAAQSPEIAVIVNDPNLNASAIVEATFGMSLLNLKANGELSGNDSVLYINVKVKAGGKEAATLLVTNRADLSYSAAPTPNISGYFTLPRTPPAYDVYIGINVNIVGTQAPFRLQGNFQGNLSDAAEAGNIAAIDASLCSVLVDTNFLSQTPGLTGINCDPEYENQPELHIDP